MRTFRHSRAGRPAMLASLALLSILVLACASGGSASLSTVGRSIDGAEAYSGEVPAEAGPSAAPAAPEGVVDPVAGGGAVGAVDDARIVRTGTMQLEVRDVPAAVAAARATIRGMGGYVGASHTSNDGDQPIAEITYRIPVDRWEDALAELRNLNGQTTKVVVEQTEAVEVTGQIVDLEARIKNLRSSEAALQAIAAKAIRISDVLEVQNQLTAVRSEIEVLTGQLVQLADRADLATLTVSFGLPIIAVEAVQAAWDPAVVVDEASASLVGFLQDLTSAGIWFAIVWLPILIVLGLVVGIAVWFLRRMGIVRRGIPPAPPAPPAAPVPPTASAASGG